MEDSWWIYLLTRKSDRPEMIALLCWAIAFPPIIALSIFSVEALFGIAPVRPRSFPQTVPSTTILMPAHDESATIERTLVLLAPILSHKIRLLVVADNCSDDTAQLVRAAGHDVIERHDTKRIGKGHALAFGRDHLRAAPPACVIVLDADCETDAQSIEALAKYCLAVDAAVQASDVLRPDLVASPKVQISNFAFWIKNVVRQRGARRTGGGAVLMGTGMAFPWTIFEKAPLATSNIVEDLALGIHLTETGRAPVFLEQALVVSSAATETATLKQRTRWEHGFLATAKSHGLRAFRVGLVSGNGKLLRLGLHLLVPPLALLMALALAGLVLLGATAVATGYWSAFSGLGIATAISFTAVLLNWLIAGRRWLSFSALLHLPLYVVWKLPVYLRFTKGKSDAWTRTERPTDGGEK